MRRNLITMAYYETYYYANIVHNILSDPFPYLHNLNSWHEDNEAVLFFLLRVPRVACPPVRLLTVRVFLHGSEQAVDCHDPGDHD